jgi:hypothetical protein|tara:strand:- start:233 stop:436 length:204 start_codon:yes stop_codon:yes gene_type:complete
MKIKEIKTYINDPSTSKSDVFRLHLAFLDNAGSESISRRESERASNKGWNILKWATKRFGEKWWETR